MISSEQYAGRTPQGYVVPEQNKELHGRDNQVLQPPLLDIGERVIWFNDTGDIEKGIVRWIGILPDDNNAKTGWMVGVESVSLMFISTAH